MARRTPYKAHVRILHGLRAWGKGIEPDRVRERPVELGDQDVLALRQESEQTGAAARHDRGDYHQVALAKDRGQQGRRWRRSPSAEVGGKINRAGRPWQP